MCSLPCFLFCFSFNSNHPIILILVSCCVLCFLVFVYLRSDTSTDLPVLCTYQFIFTFFLCFLYLLSFIISFVLCLVIYVSLILFLPLKFLFNQDATRLSKIIVRNCPHTHTNRKQLAVKRIRTELQGVYLAPPLGILKYINDLLCSYVVRFKFYTLGIPLANDVNYTLPLMGRVLQSVTQLSISNRWYVLDQRN